MQKCKRILAVVLCLLMLAAYLPFKPMQNVNAATVSTTENATVISHFNGVSKVLLYEDDFQNEADYIAARGSSSKYLYWEEGRLSYPNTAVSDSKVSNNVSFYGLSANASTMQNYTVSADVTSMVDGFMCVRAYGVYEFGIYQNKFRLYRRTPGKTLGTQKLVNTFFSEQDGYVPGTADTPGSIVTVSITATTVGEVTHLLCTATFNGVTKTVLEVDDSDGNVTAGAPGLITNTGGVDGKLAGYFYGVRVTADLSQNTPVYSLNGVQKQLVYADTFADTAAFSAAIGEGNTLTLANGRLTNTTGTKNYARFAGLDLQQNYTISAELVSKLDGGVTSIAVGVVAYNKYEFCLNGSNVRLYRRTENAAELIFGSTNGKPLTNYFSDYLPGDSITMSLHAVTENAKVYLEGYITHKGITKQICNIVDESGELLSGAPAVLISKQDTASYIESVTVMADAVETDANLLYSDSYLTPHGYGAAMSNVTTNAYQAYYQNGALLFSKTTGQQYSVFNGLTNADTLQNYSVSADFRFTDGTESLGGVSGYCNSGGKGYEFAVYQSSIRLYNRVTNQHLFAATPITSFFSNYKLGDTIRLQMILVTNEDGSVTILCTAVHDGVTKFICSYTDTAEGTFNCGAPGIRGGANKATVAVDCYADNVKVTKYTGDIEKEIFNLVGFVVDPILQPGADATSRNFNWQTPLDWDCVLEVAEKSKLTDGEFPTDSADYVTIIPQKNTATKSGQVSHKATISNLKPATEYVYRIRSGDILSDLYSFNVTDVSDGYTFSFIGDAQVGRIDSDVASWEQTLSDLTENYDVDFLLSLGDEVHTPSAKWYGGFIADELAELPTATVIGNHDTSSIYGDYFNLPNVSAYGATAPGSNYWYAYGNTLYMVLNSNNLSAEEHIAFMEEAVAANPNAIWKVVAMHHCLYSVSVHGEDDNVLALREALVPAFNNLDVDVVLMGHDHCYTRTYMMNGFEPDKANGVQSSVTDHSGILYITANSASGSKYNGVRYDEAEWAAVFEQSQRRTFAIVEVTDTKFDIVTYYADDLSVMDRITLNKSQKPECTEHVYDDDQDVDCNVCGAIREVEIPEPEPEPEPDPDPVPKPEYVVGDLNGDNMVTDADAVYLLMYTFFADTYPIKQPCDFNGDDVVTDADAVYLLMYTFFPETYPIK